MFLFIFGIPQRHKIFPVVGQAELVGGFNHLEKS